MAEQSEFMTTQQAYKWLGVTRTTLQTWVKELHIQKYSGKGRTVNYKKEDVERIYRERVQLRPANK